MHVGFDINTDGDRVSKHICGCCGGPFTMFPPTTVDDDGWENCLSMDCPSFDLTRNVDFMRISDPSYLAGVVPIANNDIY